MTAIYARQSADRKDSLSIEGQIEECKLLVGHDDYAIFQDKGFSGSSTNRPAFKQLLTQVEAGQISRIIIYRLDRISRSLVDFVLMVENFRKHNVTLISKSEGFDTSNELGIMLLNILMMFAEMERKAIRQRVTDNYYYRGKMQFYLGGHAPFGYRKISVIHNGISTSSFEVDNCEADTVREIYRLYSDCRLSLNAIATFLNSTEQSQRRWDATAVRRIIRNPTYVRANLEVYRYFLNEGAVILSEEGQFDGCHGCVVFRKSEDRKFAKFTSFLGENISIALHEGIIPPYEWLNAQKLFHSHAQVNAKNTPRSWLQGLIKCRCGYSLYIKQYKDTKYLICRGRKVRLCDNSITVRCETIENLVFDILDDLIKALNTTELPTYITTDNSQKTLEIDERIDILSQAICKLDGASAASFRHSISKLLLQKQKLISSSSQVCTTNNSIDFSSLSIRQKLNIAKSLIDEILIDDEEIHIFMA